MEPNKPQKRGTARKKNLEAAAVEAAVANKPLAEVAREEGVSRRTMSRVAGSDEVQQVITGLVASRWDRIDRLFDLVLNAVEEGLQANAGGITKDGVVYTLGADHYARLAAVSRFLKLVTVGRPTPKPIDGDGKNYVPTWEDFRALYKNSQPQRAQ